MTEGDMSFNKGVEGSGVSGTYIFGMLGGWSFLMKTSRALPAYGVGSWPQTLTPPNAFPQGLPECMAVPCDR